MSPADATTNRVLVGLLTQLVGWLESTNRLDDFPRTAAYVVTSSGLGLGPPKAESPSFYTVLPLEPGLPGIARHDYATAVQVAARTGMPGHRFQVELAYDVKARRVRELKAVIADIRGGALASDLAVAGS